MRSGRCAVSPVESFPYVVMPGLVPGISPGKCVDGRNKFGHDAARTGCEST